MFSAVSLSDQTESHSCLRSCLILCTDQNPASPSSIRALSQPTSDDITLPTQNSWANAFQLQLPTTRHHSTFQLHQHSHILRPRHSLDIPLAVFILTKWPPLPQHLRVSLQVIPLLLSPLGFRSLSAPHVAAVCQPARLPPITSRIAHGAWCRYTGCHTDVD